MNAPLLEKIAAVRTEIESVRDELQWVSDAPLPKEEVKQRILSELNRMGTGNRDSRLKALANPRPNPDGPLQKAMRITTNTLAQGQAVVMVNVDTTSLLSWVLGDELAERLYAKVDAMEYTPGLAAADRPARIKELEATLRKLETREEALVVQAEEMHLAVGRRPEADPAVVLAYDQDGEMLPADAPRYGIRPPDAPRPVSDSTDGYDPWTLLSAGSHYGN